MGSSSIPEGFLRPQAPANARLRRVNFLETNPPLPEYKDLVAAVIDDVLTEDECKQLLQIAEATTVRDPSGLPTWERALINAGGGKQVLATDSRNCGRIFLDSHELADRLLARLMPFLKELGADQINNRPRVTGLAGRGKIFNVSGLNERLRFLKYEGGEYFLPHCDGRYTTPDKQERSYFTVQLYLNGDGEQDLKELQRAIKDSNNAPHSTTNPDLTGKLLGGATSFMANFGDKDRRVRVFPRTGSVLVFQQSELLHGGDLVFRGIKYTMRTDVMYREQTTS
ncbi:uncharacterized protein ACLA_071840 [Aspergillus clavatus NRRL 1]|uniref:Prolyl 4-hydroxylase alpha subunit domain-containing protein n=1 Tax=Aspergillus clavatus (strain ATCC 1007 / CBS 513.65 / DSM 816 / NCTC 3887 / NRRL 1 / QM 1276 / 107) TaxID=344612 RepID=A1C6Y0_ASPCL|nr:uncharacterized protein ACLA_071840 [Aspergillus clavatus NRRL 1]EAW14151.1 conserved hypothetical protein [Aspergillus clavatus NRRL 1]